MKKIYSLAALLLLCWLPVLAQAQVQPDLVVVAPFNLPTNISTAISVVGETSHTRLIMA